MTITNLIQYLIKFYIILSLLISSTHSDVTLNKNLMSKFNITQIIKGVNDVQPKYSNYYLIKMYIYNKENVLLLKLWREYYLSFERTPLCIEYVVSHMNVMERVKFTCPKELGFVGVDTIPIDLPRDEIEKDLVVDLQLWEIN